MINNNEAFVEEDEEVNYSQEYSQEVEKVFDRLTSIEQAIKNNQYHFAIEENYPLLLENCENIIKEVIILDGAVQNLLREIYIQLNLENKEEEMVRALLAKAPEKNFLHDNLTIILKEKAEKAVKVEKQKKKEEKSQKEAAKKHKQKQKKTLLTKGDKAYSEERFKDAVNSYTELLTISSEFSDVKSVRLKRVSAMQESEQLTYEQEKMILNDLGILLKNINPQKIANSEREFYSDVYYQNGLFKVWEGDQTTEDLVKRECYTQAKKEFKQAINLNEHSWKAFLEHGCIDLLLYKLTAESSDSPSFASNRVIFWVGGQQSLECAIKINSNCIEAHLMLAEALHLDAKYIEQTDASGLQEKYIQAKERYKNVFDLSKCSAEKQKMLLKISNINFKLNNYDEALLSYQAIIADKNFDFSLCPKKIIFMNMGVSAHNDLQKSMFYFLSALEYHDEIEDDKVLAKSTEDDKVLAKSTYEKRLLNMKNVAEVFQIFTESGIFQSFFEEERSKIQNDHDLKSSAKADPAKNKSIEDMDNSVFCFSKVLQHLDAIHKTEGYDLQAFINNNLTNSSIIKGYCHWIEQDLKKQDNETAFIKYECVKDAQDFKIKCQQIFQKYEVQKNMKETVQCGEKILDDDSIRSDIQQKDSLAERITKFGALATPGSNFKIPSEDNNIRHSVSGMMNTK